MSKECIYDVCWQGKCKNLAISDSEFCESHLGTQCGESIITIEKYEQALSISSYELKEILENHLGILDIEFTTSISPEIIVKGTGARRLHNKCGEQAVGDCHSHAGPGVCGTPLCEKHKKTHKH